MHVWMCLCVCRLAYNSQLSGRKCPDLQCLQFLGYEHSHYGWFQAANVVMSLNTALGGATPEWVRSATCCAVEVEKWVHFLGVLRERGRGFEVKVRTKWIRMNLECWQKGLSLGWGYIKVIITLATSFLVPTCRALFSRLSVHWHNNSEPQLCETGSTGESETQRVKLYASGHTH